MDHSWLPACVVTALLAFAQEHGAPSEATALRIDVDWKRTSQLGFQDDMPAEELHAAVRDYVAWRLGASGVEAKVQLDEEHLELELAEPLPVEDLDALERMVGDFGTCEILLLPSEDSGQGKDEPALFALWSFEHEDLPPVLYNLRPERAGSRVAWFQSHWVIPDGSTSDYPDRPFPLLLPETPRTAFGASDFARVFASRDADGGYAVGFELAPERKEAFHDFTAGVVGRHVAIVVGAEVRTAPTINAPLAGSGNIEGGFSEDEMNELIGELEKSEGPLRLVR